jgi:hypothetical protein
MAGVFPAGCGEWDLHLPARLQFLFGTASKPSNKFLEVNPSNRLGATNAYYLSSAAQFGAARCVG